MRLNLGCGQHKLPGYVNVDKFDSFAPEVVWNLEQFPWPFEDKSVHEVRMWHVLEHLGAAADVFIGVMKELYRVCADGAIIHIAVPHPRSDGFASDPTHVRPITPEILNLFSKKKNIKWRELGHPNTPLAIYHGVDFEVKKAEYTFQNPWDEGLKSGEIAPEKVQFLARIYFNVVEEIYIDLRVCH